MEDATREEILQELLEGTQDESLKWQRRGDGFNLTTLVNHTHSVTIQNNATLGIVALKLWHGRSALVATLFSTKYTQVEDIWDTITNRQVQPHLDDVKAMVIELRGRGN